jgi:hypothetical protein
MKKLTVFLAVCTFVVPTALFAAKAKPAKIPPTAEAKDSDTPANGRAALFAKYDVNKNGKLDDDEIEAIRKDFASAGKKDPLRRLDTNKDGKLSDDEINALVSSAKKGGKKNKKAATVAKPDEAKTDDSAPKKEDPK